MLAHVYHANIVVAQRTDYCVPLIAGIFNAFKSPKLWLNFKQTYVCNQAYS